MSLARNIGNLPNGDDAPVFACRAWVNFDGTTNTAGFCTIRDSGNVSTVADNGTGDYTINFTTAMPDANYAVIGLSQYQNNAGQIIMEGPSDAGINSFKVYTKTNANVVTDAVFNSVAVFR